MTAMSRLLAVLLALLAAVAGACNDAKRDEEGKVQSSGDVSVYDLRPGDCFNGGPRQAEDPGEAERTVNVVTGVPCDQPHENEVFAVFDHPAPAGEGFPGEEEVTKVAQDGCGERFAGYLGEPFEESELSVAVIAPGLDSWADNDDRTIVCVVYGEKKVEGSQKAKAR